MRTHVHMYVFYVHIECMYKCTVINKYVCACGCMYVRTRLHVLPASGKGLFCLVSLRIDRSYHNSLAITPETVPGVRGVVCCVCVRVFESVWVRECV